MKEETKLLLILLLSGFGVVIPIAALDFIPWIIAFLSLFIFGFANRRIGRLD